MLCETGRHTQTQRTRSEGEPTGLVVKKLSVSTELAEAKLVGHWLLLHMQRERESVCVCVSVCVDEVGCSAFRDIPTVSEEDALKAAGS